MPDLPAPRKRIYIAGPMTGIPDYNYPAFRAAEHHLRNLGHEPVSPAGELVDGWQWHDYMRRSLAAFLTCDAVAMLPGWLHSRGARLEFTLAGALGMEVRDLKEWQAGWSDR